MRVLHVIPTYIPAWRYGGPIRSVHGLCRGLVRLGVDVHVFATNVDGDGTTDVPLDRPVARDGVQVWYFPAGSPRRLYRSPAMKAALATRCGEFDLVHTHSMFLWPTAAAVRAARSADVPYVVAPRGMMVRELVERRRAWLKRLWIRLIDRPALERAAGIHVTSTTERDELERFGFDTVTPVVIPNGVDLPKGPVRRASQGVPRILFLGRINWKKGLDRLIPAMRHLPLARLIVAGNDEEDYTPGLRRTAAELGLGARVEFTGPVPEDAKWDLLRDATLLVLPSYSENFGIVALEAMAVGCPVAVTPEVGLAETVAETESGIVVDGDPDRLGPALAALVGRPDRLKTLGANGRRTVLQRFTWDHIAATMRELYEQILESAGRA
jgi:glycosyltransferase involved in cell wall biosynthesis